MHRCRFAQAALVACALLLVPLPRTALAQNVDGEFTSLLPVVEESSAASKGDENVWQIRDGQLTGELPADADKSGNGSEFFLGSADNQDKTYREFELRMRYRVIRGEAKLCYRVSEDEKKPAGYTVVLSSDAKRAGLLVDRATSQTGDLNVLSQLGKRVVVERDGNVRVSPNPAGNAKDTDHATWHELTLVAVTNHLTHKLDGSIITECVDQRFHKRSMTGKFRLALDPGTKIEIQDVRVREIIGIFPPYEGEDADALLAPAATAGDKISVLDGFVAELVYSVPRDEQGSWVAMTFDNQGRIITSAHDGPLYRITLPTASTKLSIREFGTKLRGAQGLLVLESYLYAVINSNLREGPGLYRLTDHDHDGEFEEARRIVAFSGTGDHGPHGLVASPDKKSLLLICGNDTKLPNDITRKLQPTVWQEDQLLPRMDDPTGFATWNLAPNGWILRTNLDGSETELVAVGLRNAYDLAIDRDGEIFTFDADMEFDTGLPWYRPARINHVPSGAEFGYRHGSGKWPTYFEDSVPPSVEIGLGSPTGLVFGHQCKFPAAYRSALFALDWAQGNIYAVHLRPNGSSFTGSFERFATGTPLPVTDVAVGPDGALYFVTGGRGTQSGLYRIRYSGELLDEPDTSEQKVNKWLELRKRIEANHQASNKPKEVVDEVWPHLASPDRGVRFAARVAIEHQSLDAWKERALSEPNRLISVEALIALARCSPEPQILSRLNQFTWQDAAESELLAGLRAYDLAMIRGGVPDGELRTATSKNLGRLFPHESESVNRELCKLLCALNDSDIAKATLPLISSSATQQQQISLAVSLRTVTNGWTDESRREYFDWFDRAIAEYAGAPTFRDYLKTARADALANVPEPDRSNYPELTPTKANSTTALPVARKHVYNWQMSDLLPLLGQIDEGKANRSLESGKAAFKAARCAECHRFQGSGGNSAPDLTTVAGRFSPRDLLEAIIEPSRTIADLYRQTTIETASGQILTGRVLSEADGELRIQIGSGESATIKVLSDEQVEDRFDSNVSAMPGNLLSVLTESEVLDLMSYLLAGKNRDDTKE